ncbi:MAG: AtpZ/AtpI family protein [Verrucomicrobiota bacterium]
MSEKPEPKPLPSPLENLAEKVGRNEARKLKARRQKPRSVLAGFGLFGLVGWSVALPAMLGVALGAWIDGHYPGQYSWTLMLMILGVLLGCANVWYWMDREHREISQEQEDPKHE